MHIDNDIPKIDLPEDWIIGKLTKSEIGLLNLYANYPCRLKAEIFVLCLQGDLEAGEWREMKHVQICGIMMMKLYHHTTGDNFANISGRRRFGNLLHGIFLKFYQSIEP